MKAKLRFELAFYAAAAEQGAKAETGFIQSAHLQASWTTMLMAPESRAQFASSFSNCLRPARVSE
jgi:hypothetical protein